MNKFTMPRIDRVKSPFVRTSVTTVLVLVIVCVCFNFLMFRSDLIMSVDAETLQPATAHKSMSVTQMQEIIEAQKNSFRINGITPGLSILQGDTIDFSSALSEAGCGNFCYTYMGWQLDTNQASDIVQFRNKYYPNWDKVNGDASAWNEEGFGIIEGRYVVATTHEKDGGLCVVGQEFDIYLENGEVIPCVCGETKSNRDSNWTRWGHVHGTDYKSLSTIEFLVDKRTWYSSSKGGQASSMHANAGTANFHPEWKSPIVKIIKGDILEY